MTRKRRACAGTNAAGRPCRSPVVGSDGFCPAHRPGGSSEMRRRALKGAIASRRAKGLAPDELPALDSPQAAERWLEEVGRAVSTGRLGHQEGRAIVGAVQQWLKAHEAGHVAERLEELAGRLDELRGGGSVRRLK